MSRRTKLALDHIHEGVIHFSVFHATGAAGISEMSCNNARLVLDDEGLTFTNDVSEMGAAVSSTTTRRVALPFTGIQSWKVADNSADVTKNGINLVCADGRYCFAVEDVNHLRVSFEHFYNKHRAVVQGLLAVPGTTHGREVVSIHTLTGEVSAPAPPTGSPEVVDENGSLVRGRSIQKKGGMFGGAGQATERQSVRVHWPKVVKHNGWLLKKGGTTKSWLKRYFVLYETSQGHFLSYYAEFWDSPLYNPSRKERNMVDLSKITYLRAKSKYKDVPPFAFDIATIEREWTLCAETAEQLQLWLQLIARAVDVDVAIVPDDTLSFAVKARNDTSGKLEANDYSTLLQISAWGLSVQRVFGGEREEVWFWCYTDFYKWSILRQNGKLALSLQIFTSGDFKQKSDFIYRSVDSQAIATAIEYYIEKFMSRMHLRREVDEKPAPTQQQAAAAADVGPPPTSKSPTEPVADLLGAMGSEMSSPQELSTPATVDEAPAWESDDEVSSNGGATSGASLLDLTAPVANGMPAQEPSALVPDMFQLVSMSSPAAVVGVEVEVRSQMKGWFDTLVSTEAPGQLFRNSQLEVLYKHEFRGSQARITLKLTNASGVRFTDVGVSVDNTEPYLRVVTTPSPGGNPAVLDATAARTYVIMAECNQPFSKAPILMVKFSKSGNPPNSFKYDIPLPVLMTNFMVPVTLEGQDFYSRWDRLSAPGLEGCREVPAAMK